MARPMSLILEPGRTVAMPPRQARAGASTELAGRLVDLADEERGVGVAVHAVEEDGHVEVDDVAVEQPRSSGMPWQITSLTEVHSDFGKPR